MTHSGGQLHDTGEGLARQARATQTTSTPRASLEGVKNLLECDDLLHLLVHHLRHHGGLRRVPDALQVTASVAAEPVCKTPRRQRLSGRSTSLPSPVLYLEDDGVRALSQLLDSVVPAEYVLNAGGAVFAPARRAFWPRRPVAAASRPVAFAAWQASRRSTGAGEHLVHDLCRALSLLAMESGPAAAAHLLPT